MKITPLYTKLYSQKAPGFKNENDEIINAVDKISSHIGNRRYNKIYETIL